ncbi:hypothetical protein [Magnetospira sp. QH-2]|uniref:hypothetical protein n=1 Tax=Magnetospira sp. (strain QH-2) TaxID=1288970 RepID=UPI0005F9D846|nr:hypothetical protein [Magnetospira sp. QH-2]
MTRTVMPTIPTPMDLWEPEEDLTDLIAAAMQADEELRRQRELERAPIQIERPSEEWLYPPKD